MNRMAEMEEERKEFMQMLGDMFKNMDVDHNGTLSKKEVITAMTDDEKIATRLEVLDIHVTEEDIGELYDALVKGQGHSPDEADADEVEVKIADLVQAMSNVRGVAMAKELFLLKSDLDNFRQKFRGMVAHTSGKIEDLRKLGRRAKPP